MGRGSDYFAGTLRFNSSNQFSTTLICVGAAASGPAALTITNRWPSAVASPGRPGRFRKPSRARQQAVQRTISAANQLLPDIKSSRSLFATVFRVEEPTTPRYRAKLEQWIVANLCNRKTESVFR